MVIRHPNRFVATGCSSTSGRRSAAPSGGAALPRRRGAPRFRCPRARRRRSRAASASWSPSGSRCGKPGRPMRLEPGRSCTPRGWPPKRPWSSCTRRPSGRVRPTATPQRSNCDRRPTKPSRGSPPIGPVVPGSWRRWTRSTAGWAGTRWCPRPPWPGVADAPGQPVTLLHDRAGRRAGGPGLIFEQHPERLAA